jgi:hypothetical protein
MRTHLLDAARVNWQVASGKWRPEILTLPTDAAGVNRHFYLKS